MSTYWKFPTLETFFSKWLKIISKKSSYQKLLRTTKKRSKHFTTLAAGWSRWRLQVWVAKIMIFSNLSIFELEQLSPFVSSKRPSEQKIGPAPEPNPAHRFYPNFNSPTFVTPTENTMELFFKKLILFLISTPKIGGICSCSDLCRHFGPIPPSERRWKIGPAPEPKPAHRFYPNFNSPTFVVPTENTIELFFI